MSTAADFYCHAGSCQHPRQGRLKNDMGSSDDELAELRHMVLGDKGVRAPASQFAREAPLVLLGSAADAVAPQLVATSAAVVVAVSATVLAAARPGRCSLLCLHNHSECCRYLQYNCGHSFGNNCCTSTTAALSLIWSMPSLPPRPAAAS
jgi:hypothetical protein